MKKIPRVWDKDGNVNPECQWVLDGEGRATRKYDGTAVMIDSSGQAYRRMTLRKKQKDRPPQDWVPACARPEHGDWPGWYPVGDGPDDRWINEALDVLYKKARHNLLASGSSDDLEVRIPAGTYELCGPRINRNPEQFTDHVLIPHGMEELSNCPRDKEALSEYLKGKYIEGVVFYHPDGRMAKVRKAKDLGIPRRSV